MHRAGFFVAIAFTMSLGAALEAQRGAAQGPPPTPRAVSPVDLTGDWVAMVTEDWRWRMMTPAKGDVASIPVNAEARKVAEAWDPARDTAAGEQCKSYGAPQLLRIPGRIRISWENDTTLKVETEAGTQTRLFRFGNQPAPAGAPTYQGNSVARWVAIGGGLSAMTTGMRPGYVRKNGVPYSEKATVEEHFNATSEPNGDRWLILTTVVRDPVYLNAPWVTSTHFKKVPNGSSWTPTPCEAS
jgi:hypothetical protein